MRFRVGFVSLAFGLAYGGCAIFGATFFLACFPDYYFYEKVEHDDGGAETSAGDAGLDARTLGDAHDAADAPDPLDAFEPTDALDAADAEGG